MTKPQSACEHESLNDEIKRIIIDEGHFTGTDCPFTKKPNFSTLDSIIEISKQETFISFRPDDSIRNLLGFNASTIYQEFNLSSIPFDILSIDNFFLQCNIARGMIFKGKRSGIIHKSTSDMKK